MSSFSSPPSAPSRFIESYLQELMEWCVYLHDCDRTIVAISRKGPRLLELLVAEGLLRSDVLHRVVSERAIPLLRNSPGEVILVDDAIRWGSTFRSVHHSLQERQQSRSADNTILGAPFAVSKEVSASVAELVDRKFCILSERDVVPFVANLSTALRELGRPLDIDHPLGQFCGRFDSLAAVNDALEHFAFLVGGYVVSIEDSIDCGLINPRRWTIVLEPRNSVGLRKLRVFLNSARTRLTVCPIWPVAIPENNGTITCPIDLHSDMRRLWSKFNNLLNISSQGALDYESKQTLVTLANYLHEIDLLAFTRTTLSKVMTDTGIDHDWIDPQEYDVQLLFGLEVSHEVTGAISRHMQAQSSLPVSFSRTHNSQPNHPVAMRIPSDYRDDYQQALKELSASITSEAEAVAVLFQAQHVGIELPSRKTLANVKGRLNFGMTVPCVIQHVISACPSANIALIHRELDILVDRGAAVPFFLRLDTQDGADCPTWVRALRVGEGASDLELITIRFLFEQLQGGFKASTRGASKPKKLPRQAFEKFCVLALAPEFSVPALVPLRELGVFRGFHLYGARATIRQGEHDVWLLDHAIQRGIIKKETSGGYALSRGYERTILRADNPWDREACRAIESRARFVSALISRDNTSGNDALVSMTSAATEEDTVRAICAEFQLWLNDDKASVFVCFSMLDELAQLINKLNSTTADSEKLTRKLHSTRQSVTKALTMASTFSGQAIRKARMFNDRNEHARFVAEAVAPDTLLQQVWEDIEDSVRNRDVRERAPRLATISALGTIAHRISRVLRGLAILGGCKFGEKQPTIIEDIQHLLEALKHSVENDAVIRKSFSPVGRQDNPISRLESAVTNFSDEYVNTMDSVVPILREVVFQCQDLVREFGVRKSVESPKLLPPPKFVMLWDVRDSTEQADRMPLEQRIGECNIRIQQIIPECLGFNPASKDDGNGIICDSLDDAVAAFRVAILTYGELCDEKEQPAAVVGGIEVNLHGMLSYYPETKAVGGRAWELAARVRTLFKEVKADKNRWEGAPILKEPNGSYLVVSEWAHQCAERLSEGTAAGFDTVFLEGTYSPRVSNAVPTKVWIYTPSPHDGSLIPSLFHDEE